MVFKVYTKLEIFDEHNIDDNLRQRKKDRDRVDGKDGWGLITEGIDAQIDREMIIFHRSLSKNCFYFQVSSYIFWAREENLFEILEGKKQLPQIERNFITVR